MNIKTKLIPSGSVARSGLFMAPRYITVHNTGNPNKGADAENHAIYLQNSGKNVSTSYHYVVDDKEIYQLLPDNEVAWHAGDGQYGTGNRQSIAIEICENSDGNLLKATDNAVELVANLMKKYNIPLSNVVQHNHWSGKDCPRQIRAGKPYHWNTFLNKVQAIYNGIAETKPTPTKGIQATSLKSMTNEAIITKVGPLFTEDQKKTGVLACVSMAQFLLESAYGKSELAQEANNCFGMKKNLSGNTWAGSKWDGTSVYAKETKEQHADGTYTTITAEFRKYACVEDSIADHSAYLVGAKKGAELRYAGLKGETDYKVAAQIIKDGGYATSLTYVEKLCNLIEQLGLTRYNATTSIGTVNKALYRVRKSWDNVASQLGAFSSLENAKAACKVGYFVFDESGKVVYPVVETKSELGVGSEIKLVAGAKYINGRDIPSWVLKSKLYVREVRENGHIVFSTLKTGAITGVVAPKYVVAYAGADAFKPYAVTVTADALNVRKGPGILYGKVKVVYKGNELVIAQVKNNWGMIAGTNTWVSLKYTKKK